MKCCCIDFNFDETQIYRYLHHDIMNNSNHSFPGEGTCP